MNQVKARIRAEVFNALDRPSEGRPAVSNENILINELIREYLEFNKYHYTTSVLTAGINPSKYWSPASKLVIMSESVNLL